MEQSATQPLVGREAEQRVCRDAVVAAAAADGGVLVVSGEAGIGKTSILRELQRTAREHGLQVSSATSAWTEKGFPFGVVRQLLATPVRTTGTLDVVTPTAAAVLDLSADAPAADDLAAALQGLSWLVADLAQRRPLVLVVDDAQWADLPSLAFVEHLARRLREMPCLVVLAVREPDLGSDEQHAVLARLHRDVRHVRLAPLSPAAAGALVRRHLSDDLPPDVLERCHTATGGNPFLLDALSREIARGRTAVAELLGTVAPEEVCREVLVRLSRLDAPAQRLAAAVSVLGPRAQVRDAAALSDLPLDLAELAADRLADAGVLAPARPLSYLHPLLHQAAYADLPTGERSSLHRRAAEVLHQFGAPPGQAAAHLLDTHPGGSRAAVELLRNAAADALRTGLTNDAVGFLERAVAEPPDVEQRAAVLIELGFAQARAALPRSIGTLAAAADAGIDASTRAEILLTLGRATWYLRGAAQEALDVLDSVSTHELDPETALRVRAQRVELRIGWVDGLGGPGKQAREAGLRELDELRTHAYPPRPASAVLLGSLARLELEGGGKAAAAARLALDAIEAGEESLLYSSGADVLVWSDHDAEAQRVLEKLVAAGRRSGSPYPFGVGSLWRGVLAHRAGRVREAEADCRTCVDVMADLGVVGLTFPLAFLVDVVAERDLASAADLVACVPPDTDAGEFFLHARGRLRTAQGRYEEAVVDLRAAEPWHASPAILPWRSSLALALTRLGERKEAEHLARQELAAATAQEAPRAIGIALRALGTASGGDEGLELLHRAAAQLEQANAPLEQARALAALGNELRRQRRAVEARKPLRQALDLAHGCGADVLAEQVNGDLVAAGARPRRRAVTGLDALTAGELRVARLAAAGRSNRDIAHELFVSPWTVARHLTRVYEKLSIPGRDQLAVVLADS